MAEPDRTQPPSSAPPSGGWGARFLDAIEWLGNKLPDPAAIFLLCLFATWIVSKLLAPVEFSEIDPRSIGPGKTPYPIQIKDQMSGPALVEFLSKMVKTFTDFAPLGLVLVALLGVGVAEHTGFVNALLKSILAVTPQHLLTPMLILVGIISHTAGDTGYVLVIPLGGVIFYAAGRHPVAGIVAAFAAVSGGFSANFVPSGLDPLLQGFTQSSARILDPSREVNPLCNYFFTTFSSLLIIGTGWFITDRVIEPRLAANPVDGDPADMPTMDPLGRREKAGLFAGLASMLVCGVLLFLACWPADSPFRSKEGRLSGSGVPLMESIVPLIFLFFLIPGVVHGYVAGTIHSHRDIVKGMSKSMSTMGYYLVMAFFAAQFTHSFRESNVGALVAIKGADYLKHIQMPAEGTIVGIIVLTSLINLLIGSASAKWALIGPIFVPMLMQLGISPELTQAAYRIGDSSANIVTPLLPYFPLIVVYCQRYVKSTGIGTLISLMVPYSLTFLVSWTVLLLVYWKIGIPLGFDAPYTYPP